MNRNVHRLVFNRRRGYLIAVAETARSCGKAAGQTVFAVAGILLAPAWPQIVADPGAPRSQQATVLVTGNGVPQVNIQTPSAAGVSRNTYSRFDVGSQGAIFNNSRTNVQSQLSGWIQGNPWLATGSARIILNEVNSSNTSQLRGYMEVAGQRADVVIANPSGIVANGAGFINAGGVTLTTGTAVMGTGGSLDAYRVRDGVIQIQGAGLDTTGAEYTRILSRALQVQGGIWAKELTSVTGVNDISAVGAQVTAQPSTSAAPPFAIDVAQLGGMYAGKIFLVATEAGVGVANGGALGATAGQVYLDTSGNLINAGAITATSDVRIRASEVSNAGTVYGQGATQLTAHGRFMNSGLVAAGGDQVVEAPAVANTGTLVAGVRPDGSIGQAGSLSVLGSSSATSSGQLAAGSSISFSAGSLDLSASRTTSRTASFTASGDLNLAGASISAADSLKASSAGTLRTDGAQISAAQLTIAASTMSNIGGRIVQSGPAALQIDLPGDLDNTRGTISSGSDFTATARHVTNAAGTIVASQALKLAVASLENAQGTIYGQSDLEIQAPSIASSGTIASGRDARIAGNVSNSGVLQAMQDLQLSGGLANSGQVLAGRNASLSGGLSNTGLVQATGFLSVDTRHSMFSNAGGSGLVAGQTLAIDADALQNAAGHIQSGAALTLRAGVADNSGGTIASNASATLSTLALTNTAGLIQALGALSIDTAGQPLDNRNAAPSKGIVTAGALAIAAGNVDNRGGRIVAIGTGDAQVTAANLMNDTGLVTSASDLRVSATGALSNTGGTLAAQRDLSVIAATLTEAGQLRAGRDLGVNVSSSFGLSSDNIAASRNASISVTGDFANAGSQMAAGNLNIAASGTISNSGALSAGQNLGASAGTSLVNTGSMVGASVELSAGQLVANRGPAALIGATDTAGTLTILAPVIENSDDHTAADTSASTTILGLGNVALAGGRDAQGGLTQAVQIVNRSGLIESGKDMTLSALDVINTRRQLVMSSTFDRAPTQAELDATGASLSGQVGQANTPDPTQIGGVYIDPPHGGAMNSDYWYTTYQGSAYKNALQAISPRARIVVGGDLDASGVGILRNYWSDISAAGSIHLGAAQVDQDSWRGAAQPQIMVNYSGDYHYKTYKGVWWTLPFSNDIRYYQQPTNYDSTLTANAAITGNGGSLRNGAGGAGPIPAGGTLGTVNTTGDWVPVAVIQPAQYVRVDVTVSPSALFHIAPSPAATYYLETDSRFTQFRQWISSDYMLQQLSIDPEMLEKRLGDGLYEQRMMREQLAALTGRRFLPGYADEEEQYRALMASAVTVARQFALMPGVALTADQIAQLTSDIVWLVQEEVTLPDGRKVQALVPQVYLSGASAKLRPDGALVAAGIIDLRNQRNISNSGTILAMGDLTMQSLHDLDSRLGNLKAGAAMMLSAQQDIDLTGALLKAGTLKASAGRDVLIASATQTQTNDALGTTRSATTISRAGAIEADGPVAIEAGRDLVQRGAAITIGGDLDMRIGRNLSIETVQTGETKRAARLGGSATSDIQQNRASQLQVGGNAKLQVGGDLAITGSDVALATSSGSSGRLDVRGDVTIAAAKDIARVNSSWNAGHSTGNLNSDDETVRGASVSSGGDVTIAIGGDARIAGSRVDAQGAVAIGAQGSLEVTSVAEQHSWRLRDAGSHRSGLGRTGGVSDEKRQSTIQSASAIGGNTVTLLSAANIDVRGGSVAADRDITISAVRDVSVQSTANSDSTSSFRQESKSGLFSSGLTVTVGRRDQSIEQQSSSTTTQASTIGSVGGNVNISAGHTYRQTGSDVLAPQGDIDIRAQEVQITEARETASQRTEQRFSQSGLSVGVSSPVVSSLQSAQRSLQAAQHTSDGRLQALAVASAALDTYAAVSTAADERFRPDADKISNGIAVNLSIGSSRSQSMQTQQTDSGRDSTVAAGRSVTIEASGAGAASSLMVQGSKITAGADASLRAEGQVTLQAAANAARQQSQSSSSSGSVGLSLSPGGVSANASASRGSGSSDGQDVSWSHAQLSAGNAASITSGGDTNLRGAVVSGRNVRADVAGDLNIQSLQDTGRFDSQSSNAGFSVSVPITGSGAGVPGVAGGANSASGAGAMGWRVGTGQSSATGRYTSVTQQSGLYAGDGGFDVEVRGNTDLQAGAIASTADASKNRLSTGTLTTSDIHNEASASASSSGLALSSDMFTQGRYGATKGIVANLLDNGSAQGASAGITRAAVSKGQVTITHETEQLTRTGQTAAEAVLALNRDTASAHRAAQRQDPQALLREAQAAQTIKNEAVRAFTTFSDPAWQVMFREQPQFYKVTCPAGVDCVSHPELAQRDLVRGTPQEVQEELAKAPPGTVLAVNGIMNTLDRAGQLAMQNAKPDDANSKPTTMYLMYYTFTGNAIGELMVAGYELKLASTLGYTNQDEAYAAVLAARGNLDTTSLGHSRGTIVQTNAFDILASQDRTNPNLMAQAVGPAVSPERFAAAADAAIGGFRKMDDQVSYSYFSNDPVSVAVGGNPGVLSLSEFWQLLTTSNSSHSCYGTGAAGCQQVQYLTPNAPPGARQDNSSLIKYENGQFRPAGARTLEPGQ